MLKPKRYKSRFELPYPFTRAVARFLLWLGFALEVQGQEWLLPDGPNATHGRTTDEKNRGHRPGLILAGNHTGYLDSLVVVAAVASRFRFLMTHEVFDWGWVGRCVPYVNIIPIAPGREKRALVEAVQALQQSETICIFPEGRLSRDGSLGPFQNGVGLLQQKSGAMIVPFAICGGFAAWPEGQRLPRFGKILLLFGEPMLPDMSADRQAITQTLKTRVQALLDTGNAQLEQRRRTAKAPTDFGKPRTFGNSAG